MENCAYDDMNDLYIKCGTAMNDAMEITEEALRLNEMTPEQRKIELGRLSKEQALIEAHRMSYDDAITEAWLNRPKHDYTKCVDCFSPAQIKKLACFNNGLNMWECEQCGRVEYEKVKR